MKNRRLCTLLSLLLTVVAAVTLLASCGSNSAATGDEDMPYVYDKQAEGIDKVNTDYSSSVASSQSTYERKIIRTATLYCETKDFDGATALLLSAVDKFGGYTESNSVRGTGYTSVYNSNKGSARYAEYTFRIPSANLDAFLKDLSGAEGILITQQNMGSDEVTAAYYDLTSRLGTLEAEKESLSSMLAGFTEYNDISAMLEVQQRLYDVIEEIEAIKTQINLYDNKVAMSTVKLTLNEVIDYTVVEEPSFAERMAEAFVESWTEFGEGWLDFFVWLTEAFPTLLILAGIGLGIFFIIRGCVRKGRKKRAAEREAVAARQQQMIQARADAQNSSSANGTNAK